MAKAPMRKSSPWMRLLPLTVIVAVLVVVAVWNRGKFFPDRTPSDRQAGQEEQVPGAGGGVGDGGEISADVADYNAAERRWLEATGRSPAWPDDFTAPRDCKESVAFLRTLCDRLDTRGYIADWNLEGGTFGLLLGASTDLGSRPPMIEGGTGKQASVIQNISHLFRVLGERRIRRVLQIVILEPDLREPMALALYRWGRTRERCGEDEPKGMSLDAQYEYAAWMLSTVGGQAYLRRRAPSLEALASFYALLILDQAEQKGHNPHGIDLRPEISRCKELLRTRDLVFRERYLELIENMERRWLDR